MRQKPLTERQICEQIPSNPNIWAQMARRWNAPLMLRIGTLLLLLLTSLLFGSPLISASPRDGGGGGNDDLAGGASSTFVPTFQDAPCPFTLGTGIIQGQQVNCGYVTVPQNRATNDGKTVRLAVAIFKAPQYMHSVDPAPVLNLEGGPGGKSLDSRGQYITAQNYNITVGHHDLVLFDQRGTGYSTPSLNCTEENAETGGLLGMTERLVPRNLLVANEKSYQNCYNRLVASGIDLDGFNTIQGADDVADLIHALGYQQMTLYGSSYGTRLALTVMRLHPEVVRAAVLDSVVSPTAHTQSIDTPAEAQRAFDALFQGCAADATCNARYPNLKNVFYQVVNELNTSPVHTTLINSATKQQQSYTIKGLTLVSLIFDDLHETSLIPTLPRIIYQFKAHNYAAVSSLVSYTKGINTIISSGAFFSTLCSEEYPFITQQEINNSIQGTSLSITAFQLLAEQQIFDVCQFWKVKLMPVEQHQAVISTLPTLVVSGEYDPITSPAGAQEVASHLSQSYYYLFSSQGHGELYSSHCADQIIFDFEDDPDQQPDSSCIAHMSGPAFQ